MPAPASMTFEDAAGEVLARIGQLDDGVSNPLLLAEARAHINTVQRKLIVEHGMQTQRRKALVSVLSGQRFVDLPADARPAQIKAATWIQDAARTPLECGISSDRRNLTGLRPAWYDVSPSTGIAAVTSAGGSGYSTGIGTVTGGVRLADGHDPIVSFAGGAAVPTILDSGSQWATAPTITPPGGGTGATVVVTLGPVQVVELCPAPGSGVLEVEYQATVTKLVEDTDLLALDAEAVISYAASLLANIKNLPCAVALERSFISYIAALRSQQSPGRVVNLAAFRTEARASESLFRGR